MKTAVNRLRRRKRLCVAIGLVLLFTAACSRDPEARKRRFFENGNQYFAKADYRSAILEYRNAIAIDARFGEARAQLAESYVKTGDLSNALAEFVRAADLLPSDFDIQLKAGTLLLAANQADQALVRADAALKLRSQDISALILRGNALAGLKSFDDALKSIEEAIRLEPDRGATFTQKGFIELASGRREEAEQTFKYAIKLAPDAIEGYLALGSYYWALGRPKEAEETFHAALKIKPTDAVTNRALASLYLATARTAEAEQYLRKVADTSGDPGSAMELANYYLIVGRSKDAITRLTPLASGDQKIPAARTMLARAHAQSGDRAKARAIVDEALKADRQDLDAQLIHGQLLSGDGAHDAALAAVKEAVGTHPTSAEAQLLLGKLYAARGDIEPAEDAFRQALKISPRLAAAHVELSRLLLSAGRTTASLQSAEEALRNEPFNLNVRVALIRSLLSAGNVSRAEKELAPLLTQYPDSSDVQAMAGMVAVLKKDPAAGRAAFARALASNPDSLDALAGLVMLDLREKNFAGAIDHVESRVRAGASPQVLILAAQTHAAAGDMASAEQLLRRAIEADSTLLPAYGMLAQLYLSQKKLDQARHEFDSMAAKQSRPVAALTMSGMILQSQGQTAQARKRFEQVLAIDATAPVAANNLAWIQAEAGEQLDVALQLAQRAASRSPDVAEITDTVGWIYLKKNQPHLAMPQFERSVAVDPKNPTFHYHLGLAYLQAGDAVRGKASLERALAAGPDPKTEAEIKQALSRRAAFPSRD
jgi:tetratricopeptide (TPR) repeat protein